LIKDFIATATLDCAFNPATADGAAKFREVMLEGARMNFGAWGFVLPVCAFIATQMDGKLLDEPRMFFLTGFGDLNTEESKDLLAHAISVNAVEHGKAIGIILIAEAWTSEVIAPARLDPRRGEEVVCIYEHKALGKEMWSAQIIRKGKPKLGPWVKSSGGAHAMSRFANLLGEQQ
jgi:hypothetical protein